MVSIYCVNPQCEEREGRVKRTTPICAQDEHPLVTHCRAPFSMQVAPHVDRKQTDVRSWASLLNAMLGLMV